MISLLETVGAVTLDATAVVLLGWTTVTVFRSRERPSARAFVVLLATLTVWAVFMLGEEIPGVVSGDVLSLVMSLGQLGAAIVVPGVWTVYALGYTGRGTGLTRRRGLMLAGIALPVVLSVLVILIRPSETTGKALIASFLGTELLYLFVLFVYATYLLVGLSRTHARVSKRQVAVLTFAVGAPYIVGAYGSGSAAANGVTLGLVASGGLMAVVVRRYPVLTGFPKANHIARTRVVEGLQEAVVVLDWENHVLDANTATAKLFGVETRGIVGDPLGSVVDGLGGRELPAGATGTVSLQTTNGRRRFQFSVSAVDDAGAAGQDGGDPVARTLLLRDVTDRETREQRLTVLNRVLRHNVRNKLDIVLAHADLIEDDQVRNSIRGSATDLVALSNKARDAEKTMTASQNSPAPVDVAAVARDVVEEYRTEAPHADISLSCPDELRVASHRAVIQEILSELLDNAISHNDADTPTVDVTVTENGETAVELSVADDGPGIPDHDRQVLAEGTETQLDHARGIGLWVVNWATAQLGGDLSFAENDPRGSVVTVRLYETTDSA